MQGTSLTRAAWARTSRADAGRREIVADLIARCLHDPHLCQVLDRYRDGIVFKVPPLRALQRMTRCS